MCPIPSIGYSTTTGTSGDMEITTTFPKVVAFVKKFK